MMTTWFSCGKLVPLDSRRVGDLTVTGLKEQPTSVATEVCVDHASMQTSTTCSSFADT